MIVATCHSFMIHFCGAAGTQSTMMREFSSYTHQRYKWYPVFDLPPLCERNSSLKLCFHF